MGAEARGEFERWQRVLAEAPGASASTASLEYLDLSGAVAREESRVSLRRFPKLRARG